MRIYRGVAFSTPCVHRKVRKSPATEECEAPPTSVAQITGNIHILNHILYVKVVHLVVHDVPDDSGDGKVVHLVVHDVPDDPGDGKVVHLVVHDVPDDPGDGKVVHLVVHDDAGGGGHELAAPDQVHARRHCASAILNL